VEGPHGSASPLSRGRLRLSVSLSEVGDTSTIDLAATICRSRRDHVPETLLEFEPPAHVRSEVSERRAGDVVDVVVAALHADPRCELPFQIGPNLSISERPLVTLARTWSVTRLPSVTVASVRPVRDEYALPKRKSSMTGTAFLTAESAPVSDDRASSATVPRCWMLGVDPPRRGSCRW